MSVPDRQADENIEFPGEMPSPPFSSPHPKGVKALREQTTCLHLCQYFLPEQLEETARACFLPALTVGNPHQVLSLPAWAVRSGWFAPYRHLQMSSIWQVWLECVHLCTEGSEI